MNEPTKPRPRPVHRYQGYKWHPRGTLYERLAAFAEANGLLRSEALNQLVEDGIAARQRANGAASEDAGDVAGHVEGLRAAVARVQHELVAVAFRLDLLGPTALTITHAMAHSLALDPDNQELRESQDAAEQRILDGILESSRTAWNVVDPGKSDDTSPSRPTVPSIVDHRSTLARLLDHWTGQCQSAEGERSDPSLTTWQRRRVQRWAKARGIEPEPALAELVALIPRRHRGRSLMTDLAASNVERLRVWANDQGVRPGVALNALVDLALSHADPTAAIRPWSVQEILEALGQVQDGLAQVEARLDQQARRLDAIGALLAGVPYIVVRWSTADEDFDEDFSEDEGAASSSREERMRFAFVRQSEDLWRGQVAALLEADGIGNGTEENACTS
jgi:hypothetical protein